MTSSNFISRGSGAALKLIDEDYKINKGGYLDHLSVKDDKEGRAKWYFEYISQLKTILNPIQVQNQVDKDINKTYNYGIQDKKTYKK